MVDIKEVAENIYMIDDQLYSIPGWGSVYLINEEKKALIDTGPTTSLSVVLDGFEAAAERIMAQVCAELEPVRKMKPLYKYITEVTTPLSIAGYLKYYQKKHRVG